MFRKGQKVALNFKEIAKGSNNELRFADDYDYHKSMNQIKEWDKQTPHKITNKQNGRYSYGIMCYELDNEYWFDEDELLKIK